MNNHIKSECGDFMDITYNDDRSVISFHGKTEHGGIVTRIAMYDDENRPAPMNRATHGLLMELDELYNIVHQHEVKITWDGDEPYMKPSTNSKYLS